MVARLAVFFNIFGFANIFGSSNTFGFLASLASLASLAALWMEVTRSITWSMVAAINWCIWPGLRRRPS